jgi:hypothetical protein
MHDEKRSSPVRLGRRPRADRRLCIDHHGADDRSACGRQQRPAAWRTAHALEIFVQSEDGTRTVAAPFPIALTSAGDAGIGKFALPLSFAITQPDQGAPSFRVLVAGYGPLGLGGSETLVIEQKAIASFRDQRSLRLHVFLGSVCFQKTCGAGEGADLVCYPISMASTPAGACGPVTTPALEEVEPTRELVGILPGSPDAIVADASLDSGGSGAADRDAGVLGVKPDASRQSLDAGSPYPDAGPVGGEPDHSPVIQLASAGGGTCALRGSGRVACWGYGALAFAGTGMKGSFPSALMLSGLDDAVELAGGGDVGAYWCARRRAGTVACWGNNYGGQLGNGTNVSSDVPLLVDGLSNVTSLGAGSSHTCASKADGSVVCWGWNDDGQLGNGTTTTSYTPVQVAGLSGVVQLEAGWNSTCARKNDGTVVCWGSNFYKQLGFESSYGVSTTAPTMPAGVTDAVDIGGGDHDLCACKTDGTVTCWGEKNEPLTVDNASTRKQRPFTVPNLNSAVQVTGGANHHCARDREGRVYCWGMNSEGELGNRAGSTTYTPTLVRDLPAIVDLDAGYRHTCAIAADGSVYCWGGPNIGGELGNGTTAETATPVRVMGL